MPRLCDITDPGKPCKVRFGDEIYFWDGSTLFHNGTAQIIKSLALHSVNWHLVPEETIESLCEAAGFKWYNTSTVYGYQKPNSGISHSYIWCPPDTPIPQVKKIIAFAQEMKQCSK